jgi:pyruvate formate lyase activating enzyme
MLGELGDDVPLHFTAFHPDYKMLDREPTPPETIHRARQQALSSGLKYVYEGNILTRDGGNTQCPKCGKTLIRRSWHRIEEIAIKQGRCIYCNTAISGEFD